MRVNILKTVSRRALWTGVAATAVVTAGALSVADAEVRTVANNSVNSLKIADNTVASIDIKNGTVASIDIATGGVRGVDIATDTVASGDIAPNAITSSEIADETVTADDVADDTIGSNEIANGSLIRPDFYPTILPWFAHVDAGTSVSILDSTAFSGAGVIHSGTGVYQVSFAFNMADCGWTATRTDNANNAASPGFITVEQGASNTTLVVRTFDTTGAAADTAEDEGFAVLVSC